jgi:hypothetical protein
MGFLNAQDDVVTVDRSHRHAAIFINVAYTWSTILPRVTVNFYYYLYFQAKGHYTAYLSFYFEGTVDSRKCWEDDSPLAKY